MASGDQNPTSATLADGEAGPTLRAEEMTVENRGKAAQLHQSLTPVQQLKQHACTFALYGHDIRRQVETHHYIARRSEDLLQCAVYDSDQATARLIGIEYIVPDHIFEGFPAEEQRLWHSHAYEIKAGIWVNPTVPEAIQKQELVTLMRTYGKFWCTWQTDRGDRLPLGAPALMMSPQGVNAGRVRPRLLQSRDDKYKISSAELTESRLELPDQQINPNADCWKQKSEGFAVDIVETEMNAHAPFP